MIRFIMVMMMFLAQHLRSQELFVVTEPASNVPAGSVSFKLGQSRMKEKFEEGYNYHMMPEVTWGINKNIMVRASGFISNRNSSNINKDLTTEGGSLYAKYRFLSTDGFHSHFRMAVFGRYSINNSDIHQEEIETMGHNSGYEAGLVVTKLIKKIAVSASLSVEKAQDNKPNYTFPESQGDIAVDYTVSFGKLMYPSTYADFKQTNINLMLELAGQTLNENQRSFLDVVPSIQFIVNSQARIDIAYKHQIYSSMLRSAPNGVYFNLQYTIFNLSRNK